MTLNCDLDLVGMVDLWVLHIDSLRRTFGQFNENLSKGSGDMERTRKCYGRTDGQTDGQTDRWRPFL